MNLDWTNLDWDALAHIRAGFLSAKNGVADYWINDNAVRSYHLTFGERIGWKWDALWDELTRIAWTPPPGTWIDWGCGSGIAISRALRQWPDLATEVVLWDRSPIARRFAATQLRRDFPDCPVRIAPQAPTSADMSGAFVLLSHVWNELPETEQHTLPARLRLAQSILWMEPGSKDTGRAISSIREAIRHSFTISAPCPHQNPCGMLAPDAAAHWCHFHAHPPTLAFTDPNWRQFSEILGVDLRRLSYAYLCADKKSSITKPPHLSRPTGLPILRKYGIDWVDCRENGVFRTILNARTTPDLVKTMKQGKAGPWLQWSGPAALAPVESWP